MVRLSVLVFLLKYKFLFGLLFVYKIMMVKYFIDIITKFAKINRNFNYELHWTFCGSVNIPYNRIISSACNQGGILLRYQKLDNLRNHRGNLRHSVVNGKSSYLVDNSRRRCILFFLEYSGSDPSARACT